MGRFASALGAFCKWDSERVSAGVIGGGGGDRSA